MIFGTDAPKFVYDKDAAGIEFTTDYATDTFILATEAYDIVNGQRIKLSSTGTLPGPLATETEYYVINLDTDADTFQLSATKGGTAIDLTDNGTGTHSFNTEMTVLLDYVVVDKDEAEDRSGFYESVITNHREKDSRGEHWVFSVILNLWKYGSEAAIKSKLDEIYQYRNSDLTLYRHRDSDPFKDAAGNDVLFFIDEIRPFYMERIAFRDRLLVTFRSKDPVDFTQNVTITLQANEVIMGIGGIVE